LKVSSTYAKTPLFVNKVIELPTWKPLKEERNEQGEL
jgi:hypothetical protein